METNGGVGMTDQSDNGNRATVAGVDAKVEGVRDLLRAEFAAIRLQLAAVVGLPVKVSALDERVKVLERSRYRALPLTLSAVGVIGSIAAVLVALLK